jgi:hypothetical protein
MPTAIKKHFQEKEGSNCHHLNQLCNSQELKAKILCFVGRRGAG